ncbi:MAG: DUF503 domain-containing protein [Polyangiaceae bacterium]|nr:DUF503 domain-containing protein [Polyangiaceae bacterium]
MFVGVCRVHLRIPDIDSLKAKRSIVRKVVERTANRFTVAVAEVAEQDTHRRAVVGIAVVSGSSAHANTMIDHIVTFISGLGEAIVEDRQMEIVPFREAMSADVCEGLDWSDFEGDGNGT